MSKKGAPLPPGKCQQEPIQLPLPAAFQLGSGLCGRHHVWQGQWLTRAPGMLRCTAPCRAMGGSVPFQDALAARLDAMQLSRQDMERYIATHPPRLSKGAAHTANATGEVGMGLPS